MIGIGRQLPWAIRPMSKVVCKGVFARQMHQSPVASLFGKGNKNVNGAGSGASGIARDSKVAGSGGLNEQGHLGVANSGTNGELSVGNHPILKRMPKFMLPYTRDFIHAPVSHVTAFLILHELTAIIPLVGIWYLFHKYQWAIPLDLPSWAIDKGTHIIDKGMAKFNFESFSLQEKANFIMEGAYAYVIVKGLFPVRIIFSLLFMPTFAKYFVIPFTRIFSFKNKKQVKAKVPEIEHSKEKSEANKKKITKPRL